MVEDKLRKTNRLKSSLDRPSALPLSTSVSENQKNCVRTGFTLNISKQHVPRKSRFLASTTRKVTSVLKGNLSVILCTGSRMKKEHEQE